MNYLFLEEIRSYIFKARNSVDSSFNMNSKHVIIELIQSKSKVFIKLK